MLEILKRANEIMNVTEISKYSISCLKIKRMTDFFNIDN